MTPTRSTVRLDREAGGLVWYADAADDRPPVALLHGGRSSAAYWDDLAGTLTGSWVAALDQRGHGASDRFADYGWAGFLDDAEAFVETVVAVAGAPAVVVGHSMGGWLAYLVAARRPELVRGVVVLDAGPMEPSGSPPPPGAFADLPELQGYLAGLLARPDEETVAAWVARDFVPLAAGGFGWRSDAALLSRETMAAMLPPTALQWEALADLACPALFLMGDRGFGSRAEVVERMVGSVADGRRVLLEGAGHYVLTDATAVVTTEVEAFCRAC